MIKKRKLLIFISIFTLSYANNTTTIKSQISDKNSFKTYNFKNLKILAKKGDYVLGTLLGDKNHINWLKNFNIAELGGIHDKRVTKELVSKREIQNIKYHIGYDWMPAFYYYTQRENSKFVKWLYKNRKFATLNPEGPFLHCKKNGYDWCKEFYYNLGSHEVFEKRVSNLQNDMRIKGFNGLFFDWASGRYITDKEYKEVYKYFKKLNPKKDYFNLVANFYKRLKENGIFIVTNQAFRKEKYLLKHVDYDMTESYITTTKWIKKDISILGKGTVNKILTTNYYPIYKDSKSLKDSLYFIDLLTSYKKKYKKFGFKNFIYLNYLAPDYKKMYDSAQVYKELKPKNGIYFSYAMGKLTDNFVYAEVSSNKILERDNIYFYNLGKPLGKTYTKLKAINGYIRFFQNGFVLASEAYKKDIYLKISSKFLPKDKRIFDAFNSYWLKSDKNSLVVKLSYKKDIFSSKYLPLGRVYLYEYTP